MGAVWRFVGVKVRKNELIRMSVEVGVGVKQSNMWSDNNTTLKYRLFFKIVVAFVKKYMLGRNQSYTLTF